MQINSDEFKYHLLFSITWIFSLIFYPIWIEPTTVQVRAFIYIIITVWTLINIILFYRFLFRSQIEKLPLKFFNLGVDKYSFILISLLLVYVILHLYPISLPLTIMRDEPHHAYSGIAIISRPLWTKGLDFSKYFGFIRIAVWILLLLFIISFSLKKIRNDIQRCLTKHYILFFITLFLISALLFLFTKDLQYHLMLMRYPPAVKILYALTTSLFGINEFSVRIPQLLFTVLGSMLLFKISEEHLDSKKIGLISASFYAFCPLIFHFSAFADIGCGVVFFSILISYLYLKYIKTDNIKFLTLSFYFISLGFLYKREIVLMLVVLAVSMFCLKENKIKFFYFLKLSYFSLVPVIPYLIIGKIYPNNPFKLVLSNWVNAYLPFGYYVLLTQELSYILSILAVISIAYLLIKKIFIKPAFFVFLTCFVIYYFLYTSIKDIGTIAYPYGVDRYSMIFFPFISMSIGLFVDRISRLFKWQHSFKFISFVLIVYLILISTIWQAPPLSSNFVMIKAIKSIYFPSDKAMKWVKKNLKGDEKILTLSVTPVQFYRDKYGINRNKIVYYGTNLNFPEISTLQKLKTFCKNNKISYIMFPSRTKKGILKHLNFSNDNELTEVAKFILYKNYIYIYKID